MHIKPNQELLTIAFWDTPELREFAAGIDGRPYGWNVTIQFHSRDVCDQMLRAGLVDVAIIPTVEALSQPEVYAILPAVALSSWKSDRARIRMEGGLREKAVSLAFAPEWSQEALLARIVLKEHYGMQPAFQPDPDASSKPNSVFVQIGGDQPSATVLDLGQEWFELTNYPMVWGVFVVRPGEGNRRIVDLFRDAAAVWERDREESPEPFMTDEFRFRLDDVATASLTELCDLLYYYRVSGEIPAVAFADIREDMRHDPTDDDDGGWPSESPES